MVGWSRRNAESRARRRRWWNSLSEDEKDVQRVGESKLDLAFDELAPWFIALGVFLLIAMGVYLATHPTPPSHEVPTAPHGHRFLP
jgi:hypothetical protein